MEFGLTTLVLAFGAGLVSVASPCVLPVVPLIVTGTADEHRARPALVVLGIAVSFMAMGVVTSLFGAAVAPVLPALEKITGVLVIGLGLLLLAEIDLFKRLSVMQRFQVRGGGRWSGLVVGLSLGLVWIPCVGPMLSGVLATVASRGTLVAGVVLLAVYSLGFAVPMLAVGYGSQAVRTRLRAVAAHPVAVRRLSGLVLVGFGVLILYKGMLVIGM